VLATHDKSSKTNEGMQDNDEGETLDMQVKTNHA